MEARLTQVLPVLARSIAAGGPAEDLVRALTAHTPVGVFLSDRAGACRFVNQRWCDLTGLSFEQALGDGWAAALHPDDRERVGAEWAAAAAEGRDSVIGYRFQRPNGSVAWIEGYASAFRNPAGELVGWIGSCLDVTAYRLAELDLEREREVFRVAFEEAPIGMALVGLDGRCLRANKALCRLLGYPLDELLLLSVPEVTHPDDLDVGLELMQRLTAGEIGSYQLEKRYLRKDGTVVWGYLSVSLIRDLNRAPLHFVAHIEDISERKHAERELRDLAERDSLTGLLNRRSFQQELERRLQLSPTDRWVLLLIDVDRFKRINDLLGHQAGDDALRAVGAALHRHARSDDLLARLGGDEFAVLANSTDAAATGARLLQAVRTAAIPTRSLGGTITVSIGVAEAGRSPAPSDLIAAADEALYTAKRAGRNQYALASKLQATA
jgi:diguanylate cyclase (GGDEF)-like protein/PAS domain S-box-containing protein